MFTDYIENQDYLFKRSVLQILNQFIPIRIRNIATANYFDIDAVVSKLSDILLLSRDLEQLKEAIVQVEFSLIEICKKHDIDNFSIDLSVLEKKLLCIPYS